MVKVEIIFVDNNKYIFHSCLYLSDNATVIDAVKCSGLLIQYPEILTYKIGIYAKLVTHDTKLNHKDRIEIYRELHKDPKEIRRIRANKKQ